MYIRNIKLLKGNIPDLDPTLKTHIYINADDGTFFFLQPARKDKRFDTYWLTSFEIAIGSPTIEKYRQLALFSLPLPQNRFEHIAHKQCGSLISFQFKNQSTKGNIKFISETNSIAVILAFMPYFEYSTQPYTWLIRDPNSLIYNN
jgi:hypothetical protein